MPDTALLGVLEDNVSNLSSKKRAGWFNKCQLLCNLIGTGSSRSSLLPVCEVYLASPVTSSKWSRIACAIAQHIIDYEWTSATNMAGAVWGGVGPWCPAAPEEGESPGPSLSTTNPQAYVDYVAGGIVGAEGQEGADPAAVKEESASGDGADAGGDLEEYAGDGEDAGGVSVFR